MRKKRFGLMDLHILVHCTVKPVLSGHSKRRPKIGFQDPLSLNSGQKYSRMLQGEHSVILSTFIKLPFAIKMFFVYFLVAAYDRFYSISILSSMQENLSLG